ncbi:MAG: IncP-type DNA transfer coupling protein TraG [Proteobacteria bacterium]|nr:MAG: IncP-type DNA transfer coupling protein TraG [Pseudomonadota bacterium]
MNSSPVLNQDKGFFNRFTRVKPYQNLHGSARFAEFEEIEKMGLLGTEGVYVGGVKQTRYFRRDRVLYLRHNGPEHVLAFAPTRSGKGIGLVIPTLLSWQHSAVILDIKGENWALTAGWRQKHANNVCLRFDPAAQEGSVRFNPLAEIRLGTEHEVADVQNIATMIVDPDGKGLNDHWSKTGYSLIVGIALHCLYVEKAKGRVATILDIANCLADPNSPTLGTLQTMIDTEHRDNATHPVVASCAREMMNKSENELSGVVSTAMSFLSLYRDPIVAKNTSESDFKISDLMNHEKPVSLYLIVPPSDKDRLKPLLRLIVNQIVRTLTRKMEFKDGEFVKSYKHRLLLMMDEFPALGKLDIFQESLAFIAGYGLKAFLITQDLSQLYAAYGKDESIISNCHIRIAYAPNKPETQELLSKMLGTSTVNKLSVSVSKKPGLFQSSQYSESYQEVQRPLLTPAECATLPGSIKDAAGQITEAGDMLIFSAGFPAIYGKQILFFKDPVFLARSKVPPPLETDRIFTLDELLPDVPLESELSDLAFAGAVSSNLASSFVPSDNLSSSPVYQEPMEEPNPMAEETPEVPEAQLIEGEEHDESDESKNSESFEATKSDSLADFCP